MAYRVFDSSLSQRGLAFRGKAAKDIDIVSKGYRYAIVYPSIHPNGNMYLWFYGTIPDAEHVRDEIPHISQLPRLPDTWLDYLTAGRTEFTLEELDLDSSVDEIYEWAGETFFKPKELCYRMMEKLELHKRAIDEDSSSHDKITNAHWNLISLAAEGHYGVLQAINEIEKYYSENVIRRQKRGLTELQGEIFRSRINAFRKIKVEIEARLALGAMGVPPDDPECCGATVALRPVQEYAMTDDGNGEHFVDMFTKEFGPAIRYVDGYGWIIWKDEEGETGPHWERDRDGDQMIRRMWWQVRDRQLQYVEGLKADLDNEIAAAIANGLPTGTQAATPNSLKVARALYLKWAKFAEKSGMNKNATDAIRNARSKERIQISINDLDKNPQLIACKNGVLCLNGGKVVLRDAKPEDYLTMNTNVMWERANQTRCGSVAGLLVDISPRCGRQTNCSDSFRALSSWWQ